MSYNIKPEILLISENNGIYLFFQQKFCKIECLLEFVLAISLISFGSSQTFFLPHLITEAANRFCSLKELKRRITLNNDKNDKNVNLNLFLYLTHE